MDAPPPLDAAGRVSSAYEARLAVAVASLDRPEAARLADALADALRYAPSPNIDAVGRVLGTLRQLRLFASIQTVAEAALSADPTHAQARRQYAQALIERGALVPARYLLDVLAADTVETDPAENAEARGLLGRVYKQAYVRAAAPRVDRYQESLRLAVGLYLGVYDQDSEAHTWHGVNALALLYRAGLDDVAVPGAPDLRALAESILGTIRNLGTHSPWDLATAMEASVGLGDLDSALGYAYRYVSDPSVDAFQLASTLRQMVEVWDLDCDDGGPRQEIVDLLRAHLLRKERGGFRISPSEVNEGAHAPDVDDDHLEAVLGRDAYVTIEWYRQGLTTAQAVAKVRSGLDPVGTGFLLQSDALGFSGPPRPVLITNNHVLSTADVSRAVRPGDAEIVFEAAAGGPFETTVERVLFEDPPEPGLDVAVALLHDAPPGVAPLATSLRPPLNDPDTVRLYSIGHPLGGGLAFSIQDNLLLDIQAPLLHYRTPTDKGSSGSPVLNRDWRVVGLHRAGGRLQRLDGSGLYPANEGVLIQDIARTIAESAG